MADSHEQIPPEPAANTDEPAPHASTRRIRNFIGEGSHPDSQPEATPQTAPRLRNGDVFPFVIAVIPAYNEQDSIVRTIRSLRAQTRRPDDIIVLADNCTDNTVALALSEGVSVEETVGNSDGKAGALNWLMNQILPILDDDDVILVMDADTVLSEGFIQTAVTTLLEVSRKPIAGVGGIFLADDEAEWNLVRQLQSNEYVRYQRRLSRRRGRALVLTGTGTVFRVSVLRHVVAARNYGVLPDFGQTGSVYDTSSLTEDNELTLSVKELGYRVNSPKECTVKTAMMPTLKSLFKQRLRWQRGALENLIAHGVNRHTVPYLLRQILTYLGVIFLPFYVYTLTVALVQQSGLDFFAPLWVTVGIVYIVEQTFSVRKGGVRAVVVSLAILPELFLNVFLDVVYVLCLFGSLWATDENWGRMRNLQREQLRYSSGETSTQLLLQQQRPKNFSTLHGTHLKRQTARGRMRALVLTLIIVVVIVLAAILPLVSLESAWNVLAVYVLIGFGATLVRLVPVRTS